MNNLKPDRHRYKFAEPSSLYGEEVLPGFQPVLPLATALTF